MKQIGIHDNLHYHLKLLAAQHDCQITNIANLAIAEFLDKENVEVHGIEHYVDLREMIFESNIHAAAIK